MPMGELALPFQLENPETVGIELTPFSLDYFCGRTRPRKPTDLIQAIILTSDPQSLAQDLQAGSEGLQWILLWHFPSLSPQLPLPAPHVLPCTGFFSMEEKAHEPLRRGVTNSSLPDVCDYQLHKMRKITRIPGRKCSQPEANMHREIRAQCPLVDECGQIIPSINIIHYLFTRMIKKWVFQ